MNCFLVNRLGQKLLDHNLRCVVLDIIKQLAADSSRDTMCVSQLKELSFLLVLFFVNLSFQLLLNLLAEMLLALGDINRAVVASIVGLFDFLDRFGFRLDGQYPLFDCLTLIHI